MGLIFAKLWSFFCNQEHKVIIVGLDNAGKTTILYQFLMNEVVHTSPTIGSNVEEIVVKNTHFLMWDIGGQESLRSSWNTYYSNTEVRNTSNTFLSYHQRGTEVVSSSQRVLFSSSWCVCSESTDGSRGVPSQRSAFSQRGPSEKQSGGQPLLCLWGGEGESRGRCEGEAKDSALKKKTSARQSRYFTHGHSTSRLFGFNATYRI
uniref:ADP-ribosylation factor-like 8 n=1 Tax=Labrus bergylta TaxID=56723 RepID=A0A3Q3FTV4_9LABR